MPYAMFKDAIRYAWTCVLTQVYTHNLDGKEETILHPITYAGGLFRGSQITFAVLTKEECAICMYVENCHLSG